MAVKRNLERKNGRSAEIGLVAFTGLTSAFLGAIGGFATIPPEERARVVSEFHDSQLKLEQAADAYDSRLSNARGVHSKSWPEYQKFILAQKRFQKATGALSPQQDKIKMGAAIGGAGGLGILGLYALASARRKRMNRRDSYQI